MRARVSERRSIVVVTGMSGAGRSTALHVLEDLGGDHHVEGTVRVGQGQCVADDHLGFGRRRCLTGLAHRLQHGVDLGQFLGILVEGDDVGTTAISLVAVPACTAAARSKKSVKAKLGAHEIVARWREIKSSHRSGSCKM